MNISDAEVLRLIANSGLVVRFVLAVLLFFSMACWAIIVTKAVQFKRAQKENAAFVDYFWRTADLSKAFARAKQLPRSSVGRAFRAAYAELARITQAHPQEGGEAENGDSPAEAAPMPPMGFAPGRDNIERALRRSSENEVIHLSSWIPFLATTGNTAPFIGLFGTVWGIMDAFQEIGLRGSASLAVVAPGISEALVATAAGLAAAIPAVIAYNHFMTRIRFLESQMSSFSFEFINIVEREILPRQG
ncbi:MAG: MotA/TolQ/ExbB proton channel family protein [Proteobacteria bacterium]|nr:MotA/TolQ/ExbB proton channel family protein [Pseudomonadota bacterium]